MLQFKKVQTIGVLINGLLYWFATGNFVGCLIATVILLLFVSFVPKVSE